MKYWNRILFLGSAALLAASSANAQAPGEGYPDRPIRMIVGFVPGGLNDILGRLMAKELSAALHQPVVVENRPGAGGLIGTDVLANAKPDGYTLLLAASGSATIAPAITPKMNYDPRKDVAAVALVGDSANVLTVNSDSPFKSVQDIISAARKAPGEFTYASSGTGSTLHMSGALFASQANIKLLHIPYKGNAPALNDVIAGRVHMGFLGVPAAISAQQTGKVRLLAVTSDSRVQALPDLPTIKESGLPNYSFSNWFAIFTTGGTPPEIINRLAKEVDAILKKPDVQELMLAQGVAARTTTPAALTKQVDQEITDWTSLVKAAGITAD